MATTRTEEYLESIFKLEQDTGTVSVSRLAKHLGLSVPSASEMAKKLKAHQLISTKGKKVFLTPKGTLAASKIVRRHRLIERLLTDKLGVSWEQVHEEACRLEHGVSEVVETKLAEYLGDPESCPHGHPIPDAKGEIKDRAGTPLSSLEPGQSGEIAEVPEEDREVLKYLRELGLKPGASINLEEQAPFDGPLLVAVGSRRHAISRKIADQVRIVLQ